MDPIRDWDSLVAELSLAPPVPAWVGIYGAENTQGQEYQLPHG